MSNVDATPALPVANNGPIGWIVLACRLIVGATFLYASLDKLAHPVAFAQSVHNYHLVPLALLHPFALLLPAVEATIGVALLVGFWRRGAALLGAVLVCFCLAEEEPVDHRFNVVHLVAIELNLLVHIVRTPIHAHADVARSADVFEHRLMVTFAIPDEGSQHLESGAGRHPQDAVDYLLRALPRDLAPALGAVGNAYPSIE